MRPPGKLTEKYQILEFAGQTSGRERTDCHMSWRRGYHFTILVFQEDLPNTTTFSEKAMELDHGVQLKKFIYRAEAPPANSEYWQIKMASENREVLWFVTPWEVAKCETEWLLVVLSTVSYCSIASIAIE